MTLVAVVDIVVVILLVGTALAKGFERTLPLAACLLILFPNESQIQLPGLFDLTTQRLVVTTLLGLYIAFGKTSDESGRKRQVPLKCLMAIQILWMFVSTANSVVFTVSLKTVVSQMLDYFLVLYIVARTVSRAQTVQKMIYSLVIAMIICSAFGAVEAYTGWSVISLFPQVPYRFGGENYLSDRGIRVQSTFGHAILFGGALAMAIPLALYLTTAAKTSRHRLFLWAGILLMFLNIYKTSSRGPWLALILSLGTLLALGEGRVRNYLLALALLVVTVLVVRPGVRETIVNMYLETGDPDSPKSTSYQWRYALYRLAVDELGKDTGRTLWGYGPESFYYLGLTTQFVVDGQLRTVKADSCDSSIAALMIETGYVGLLATAALLLKPAFVAYRSFRSLPRPANSLCVVLLVNLLAFYFLMSNVAIYGWGQQSYMLWVVITLCMIYPRLVRAESRASDWAAHERAETAAELAQTAAF